MHLAEFQDRIAVIYGDRDRRRGRDATFRWLVEEVGELARALRSGDQTSLTEEVSDVLAWTLSVATLCGVDAETVAARFAAGCPKCHEIPCACPPDRSA